MNALLKAELLRLFSRRLLLVVLVCMAGLAGFGAAVYAGQVRPLSEVDQRMAVESLEQEKSAWTENCGDAPEAGACEGWEVPTDPDGYLRVPVGFGEYAENVLTTTFPLTLLAVAVLAVALVGAEFASGNIGTQLLFTPGRVQLLISKVAAASVGGILVAFTYLGAVVVFCSIMFLSLRGAHDMTAGMDLPLALGRLAVLSLVIAIGAAGLAMAVGSTLIASGVIAVVFLGSTMLSNTISGRSLLHLFLPDNMLWAMISGQHEIYDWTTEDYASTQVITYDWALGYSVVGVALILVVAGLWFRRRDILR